jgi:hypothetical protein
MKFIKEPAGTASLSQCSPQAQRTGRCSSGAAPLTNAAVVISGEMDAMELIRTADSLNDVASKFCCACP